MVKTVEDVKAWLEDGGFGAYCENFEGITSV